MLRRDFLAHTSTGLGAIALAWMLNRDSRAEANEPRPGPHFAPKAKRVVQIFCPGGVSHVDTFDYKPELVKLDGKPMTGKGKTDTFFGQPGNLMKSPFAWKQYGQSGRWMTDLFPALSDHADDLTFIHSMVAKSANHTPAAFQMNSGFVLNGFPSMGSWISYGLGSMTEELPTFVVLPDPRGLPAGGAINWSSGFLPATHQGVALRTTGDPIPDLSTPADTKTDQRRESLEFLNRLNSEFAQNQQGDSNLQARVRSYEMAAKMQAKVPQVVNLNGETEATRKMYGLDDPASAGFGRNCLLARRLLENGVGFVQLFHGGAFGSPRINWDGHEDLKQNHREQARVLDRPVAGLLRDMKQRGMMDDTLFLWTTEFGRTPFTQGVGKPGRDHHQHAFTVFMSGAGLKPGFSYGQSDEIGYNVAEDPVTVYDFHATVLHLLGLDHTKLTYYHNGTQRRLTDVHGEVVEKVLK